MTKKIAIFIFLCFTSWVNAQCCPEPIECSPLSERGQLLPIGAFCDAYNASARIDAGCKWKFFVDTSFIYWQARQKGMDFGYAIPADPNTDMGQNLFSHFNFHPGFRIGLGMDIQYDGWAAFANYARLRLRESISSDAPSWAVGIEPTWLADTFNNGTDSGPTISQVTTASNHWKFAYDMIDFGFNRPSYMARTFIFNPFGGFRIGLMTQHLKMDYTVAGAGVIYNKLNQMIHLLGPRGGAEGKFLFDYGLRFEGNVALALLYQVARVKMKRQNFVFPFDVSAYEADRIRYFAPNIDMSLGLGWGSYFNRQNWFLDLSLVYEIQYYWSQNWMRHLKDAIDQRVASDAGDLQMHGFTGTVQVNF